MLRTHFHDKYARACRRSGPGAGRRKSRWPHLQVWRVAANVSHKQFETSDNLFLRKCCFTFCGIISEPDVFVEWSAFLLRIREIPTSILRLEARVLIKSLRLIAVPHSKRCDNHLNVVLQFPSALFPARQPPPIKRHWDRFFSSFFVFPTSMSYRRGSPHSYYLRDEQRLVAIVQRNNLTPSTWIAHPALCSNL